jgi:ferric-dicitrate binding protein FerR (iron transport regulator)
MNPKLRAAFAEELRCARQTEASGDPARAWQHLERAHVLSQAYAWPHAVVHARMLVAGWRRRDARELWGQLVRLAVAAPGSWLGRAPLGNTGGADVGILTPMPIPAELRELLQG